MKKIKLLLLGLLVGVATQAQKNIAQSDTYDLSGKFQDWKTANKMLLVGTAEGFSGIDAHKPGVKYTYTDLGKIKPEEMEILPNTPWVVLQQLGGGKFDKIVFDYITGKPLIQASKLGWRLVTGYKYLPENGQIIFQGINEKTNYAFAAYNIADGKEIAFIDLGKKSGAGTVTAESFRFEDDKLFIAGSKATYCYSLKDYSKIWENKEITFGDFDDPNFFWDEETKSTYIYQSVLNGKLYRIDNATGASVWKKPTKLSQAVKEIKKINGGLWLYGVKSKSFVLDIYDPETGQSRWKKPFEEDGDVEAQIFTDNSYIFGSNQGEVNSIDFNGNKVLKKPIKTGAGFNAFNLNEKGNLFYLTQTNMGVANLQDGTFVKNPAKFKKIDLMTTAYDNKNDKFVVSTGNEVFILDKDGNSNKIADIKFQGSEYPKNIEFRDGGILLSSDQNALLLDYDGKIKYNVFFKAPGKSAFGAIMAAGMAAASASMAMNQAARAGAMQGITKPGLKTSYQANAERNSKMFSNNANQFTGEMLKRFSASAATKDYLYILTKLSEGVGLVKINKDTGATEAQIILKDKEPKYLVDEDAGVFYYKKSDKQIVSYDLK